MSSLGIGAVEYTHCESRYRIVELLPTIYEMAESVPSVFRAWAVRPLGNSTYLRGPLSRNRK
jgi:hypothetical protein